MLHPKPSGDGFLSIQAQDFIEEPSNTLAS